MELMVGYYVKQRVVFTYHVDIQTYRIIRPTIFSYKINNLPLRMHYSSN